MFAGVEGMDLRNLTDIFLLHISHISQPCSLPRWQLEYEAHIALKKR